LAEFPDAPRRGPEKFVDGSIIILTQEKFAEGLKF